MTITALNRYQCYQNVNHQDEEVSQSIFEIFANVNRIDEQLQLVSNQQAIETLNTLAQQLTISQPSLIGENRPDIDTME